jgi:hypothetical protein
MWEGVGYLKVLSEALLSVPHALASRERSAAGHQSSDVWHDYQTLDLTQTNLHARRASKSQLMKSSLSIKVREIASSLRNRF